MSIVDELDFTAGIMITVSDYLPKNSMVVSRDVFDRMKEQMGKPHKRLIPAKPSSPPGDRTS